MCASIWLYLQDYTRKQRSTKQEYLLLSLTHIFLIFLILFVYS